MCCSNLVRSKLSCSSGIVPEQASQTLPAFDALGEADWVSRLREQDDVALSLMRTLGMIMLQDRAVQNVSDGLIRDSVAEMSKSAYDPVVTPARILARELDDQRMLAGKQR